MADEIAAYRKALREIANGAVRCEPCAMRGVATDAVADYFGSGECDRELSVCSAHFTEHPAWAIGAEPVVQPLAVLIARKALEVGE